MKLERTSLFVEALKNPVMAKTIGDAINTLEDNGVFAYLREISDVKLIRHLETKADINGLVVSSAKKAGYAEALENLKNLLNFSKSVENVLGASTYGVTPDQVKQ